MRLVDVIGYLRTLVFPVLLVSFCQHNLLLAAISSPLTVPHVPNLIRSQAQCGGQLEDIGNTYSFHLRYASRRCHCMPNSPEDPENVLAG
jgi:hypothetical protein